MKFCCAPYTWSALSPVKATEDMTHPVGQRDGQLYTAPTGGVPEPLQGQEGYILQVVGGKWTPANTLSVVSQNVDTLTTSVAYLQTRIGAVENELDGVRRALITLNGEVV